MVLCDAITRNRILSLGGDELKVGGSSASLKIRNEGQPPVFAVVTSEHLFFIRNARLLTAPGGVAPPPRGEALRNRQRNLHQKGLSKYATVAGALCVVLLGGKLNPFGLRKDAIPAVAHKFPCRSKGCLMCIMECCPPPGDHRRIQVGSGGQGLVFMFRTLKGTPYAVKQIPFRRSGFDPSLCAALEGVDAQSEGEQNSVVSAIVGELRRIWLSGPHFVPFYGARFVGGDNQPTTKAAPTAAVEFVMEYMDWTLESLRMMAAVIDQQTHGKLAVKHGLTLKPWETSKLASPLFVPTSFCNTFPESDLPSPVVAVLALLAVTCTTTPTSTSIPYYAGVWCSLSCGCPRSLALRELPLTMRDAPSVVKLIAEFCWLRTEMGDEYESQKGILPEGVIAAIAQQVGCGLSALRRQNIVHKDIKPSNILVNKQGQVKIGDFGTSKTANFRERGEKMRAVSPSGITTPDFQAPELTDNTSDILGDENFFSLCDLSSLALGDERQVVNQKEFSTSIDVWAFGVTILRLATGHREGPWCKPLDAFSEGAECVGDFRIPGVLSESLQDFIGGCCRYLPEERTVATLSCGWHDNQSLLRHDFVRTHCGSTPQCQCHDRRWVQASLHLPLSLYLNDLQTLYAPYLLLRKNCGTIPAVLTEAGLQLPKTKASQSWMSDEVVFRRHLERLPAAEYNNWCTSSLAALEASFKKYSKRRSRTTRHPPIVEKLYRLLKRREDVLSGL